MWLRLVTVDCASCGARHEYQGRVALIQTAAPLIVSDRAENRCDVCHEISERMITMNVSTYSGDYAAISACSACMSTGAAGLLALERTEEMAKQRQGSR